ncbi:hypothetical protein GOBAR_AA38518 [Gossypium barbadense]|uniref:SAC domain-containing protein n=1 Tax=Gossypium barbadense TaxID=3634 RepID=A0A2P5VTR0_GOSBA|nr:hypothetical protein GOBAR_AA38518 [Gossypium barbadense]
MMERAESCQKLYTRLRLWEFPDEYVIEPTDGSSASSLKINRADASMKLIDAIPECGSVRVPKIQTIFGVVGMLKLVAGSYLIVITERECVGSYLGHPIFKVMSLRILPCDHSLKTSPPEQKKVESEFAGLLKVAEKTCGLFFSYDTNLTLSAQRLNDLGDESKLLPLWRQLDPYLLPVVQGSFHNFQAAIGKEIVDITLIARRCTRRNGTRMWRRGADPDGYVANFVETEQIVQMNGFTASFVQVRGSMPFLWEQIVDLTYKPKFEIVKPEEAPRVAERHFLDLRKKYGSVLAIDLVNTTGGEGRLSEKFASAVQPILSDDLRYIHFDFHKICGHVHFERLSILYDQIADFLDKNGYLLLNDKGEKMKEQLGVVRTNCIDCLDRTNVTQCFPAVTISGPVQTSTDNLCFLNAVLSVWLLVMRVIFHRSSLSETQTLTHTQGESMIGRKMLELQLRRIGVFAAEETISSHTNLDEKYKILWANHGDDVSIQYSGTPALKGDFVRYGKRTVQGILNDFYNALGRYYFNNFSDGTKQDAIDLLQGHYIVSVSRDMTPPSQKGGLEAVAVSIA